MAADGERSPLLSEPVDGGAGGNGLVGPGGSGAGPGGGLTPSAPPYGAGKHAPPQGKPGRARGTRRGGAGRGRVAGAGLRHLRRRWGAGSPRENQRRQRLAEARPSLLGMAGPLEVFHDPEEHPWGCLQVMSALLFFSPSTSFLFSVSPVSRGAPSCLAWGGSTPLLTPDQPGQWQRPHDHLPSLPVAHQRGRQDASACSQMWCLQRSHRELHRLVQQTLFPDPLSEPF